MEKKKFWVLLVLLSFISLLLADHLMAQTPAKGKYDALKRKYVKGEYSAPRYPSYLKPPKSVDEVMPYARAAVRQVGGRAPLGLVNPGQTVLIVTEITSEEILLQAIKKAYEERGVKVQYLPSYEAAGASKKDASELHHYLSAAAEGHLGLKEANAWFEMWDPKQVITDWLKERRPDLYQALYGDEDLPGRLKEIDEKAGDRTGRENIAKGIIRYLDAHPEVNALFWGKGGRSFHFRLLGHQAKKYYGNMIFDKRAMLLSRVPSFPGDLWRLLEERTVESLGWVDHVRANDPEGTDLDWEVTPEEAEGWAKGVYQQGHLFMTHHIATGRFPYNVLEYPALQNKYLPALLVKSNGVVAGCNNHAGMYPRVELTVKDGYLREIKGEGPYPEIWREVYNHYPNMHTFQYPYNPEPGYFWFWECGLGTNPKFFLSRGDHSGERNRSGVVHWSFGPEIAQDPENPGKKPEKLFQAAKENKLPSMHWMHVHNEFLTYQVRVRGTEKWLTLINKGRLSALDDPMVRALASRYGDPDDLLTEEWIPHIPGINAPGNYAEYSKDPRKFLLTEFFGKIEKGTYEYFYTPPSMRKKK